MTVASRCSSKRMSSRTWGWLVTGCSPERKNAPGCSSKQQREGVRKWGWVMGSWRGSSAVRPGAEGREREEVLVMGHLVKAVRQEPGEVGAVHVGRAVDEAREG